MKSSSVPRPAAGEGRLMRALALTLAALLLADAAPAVAEGPEQLEQLEPERGELQLEYYGLGAAGAGDEHSLQLLYGVTDRLALGIEVEPDAVAPTLLYRFSDPREDPVGIGIEAQAEFDGDARLVGAEARLILERRRANWWLQGNLMLRREREDRADWRTGLGYGWAFSRSLGGGLWLGLEGSGQASDGGHYAGPAFTIERELEGGAEIEIGLSYQRRLDGEGPRDSARLFVQVNL